METIEIPCKIGSYVYRVRADKRIKKPDKCRVVGVWVSEDVSCNTVHLYCYKSKHNWYSVELPFSAFGDTLFLTTKEAENKMAVVVNKITT